MAEGMQFTSNTNPKSPDQAMRDGEGTVTMVFPVDVLLTLPDHTRVLFKKGTQEVPESLADHDWLKANGAKKYTKPPAPVEPAPAVDATMTEEHVAFLRSRGYKPETVADAQSFFDHLGKDWIKQGFLSDFAAWKALPVVSDRAQGVDCPMCENNEPHRHAPIKKD